MLTEKKIEMKYRVILFLVVAVSAIFLNSGCSINPLADSEAGNPTVISSSALINMPTSLADNSITSLRTGLANRTTDDDEAENIYDFIRLQNYFVNELINGDVLSIRWLIEEYIAKLPWNIIKHMPGGYIYDSLYYHYEAIYNVNSALPYSVLIEYTLPGSEWVLKASFNGDAVYPKGWVYYFLNAPEDNRTDSLEVLVSFDKSISFRRLYVEIDQRVLVDTGDIAQSFIYSLYEEKGIVHLSASTYHPYLDSILGDTVGYCYTYTAVADTIENKAVVNLGLPPATYADTALLFTEYGISNIYGRFFIDYEIKTLDDSSKMILATSYKDSLTILDILWKIENDTSFTLRDPSEADSITVEDLVYYLELNKGIIVLLSPEEKIKYIALLWILKLTQPVYFNEGGYAGNGETVPSGFETIAAITCNRSQLIPLTVKELSIDIPR